MNAISWSPQTRAVFASPYVALFVGTVARMSWQLTIVAGLPLILWSVWFARGVALENRKALVTRVARTFVLTTYQGGTYRPPLEEVFEEVRQRFAEKNLTLYEGWRSEVESAVADTWIPTAPWSTGAN